MKEYKCEYYKVMAHERSCFFCRKCTDIWWDYTNGPYMFYCTDGKDIDTGLNGECEGFEGEEQLPTCGPDYCEIGEIHD